jgi:NAD(P)-dependent dehydrogenase (short-subunit alcohol dehydrogenase family)
MEGAHVAIQYLDEDIDAHETHDLVEQYGRHCLLFSGDLSDKSFCDRIVSETVKELGHLDILVNNAAEQFPAESVEELNFDNLESTFRVNCFSMFYLTQAALPHLKKGSSIINTASVTAYRGSPQLLDYSATKGAIVAFTRSLSKQLIKKGIYVNAVAPGPVWTPLISATFPPDKVAEFGTDVPMGRAAQPSEIAPCYVFLASDDSSYMSGQVLHPNGGEIING